MSKRRLKTAYAVYDMKAKEGCIGIMSAQELADYIGIKRDSIYRMVSRGDSLIKNRYKAVKVYIDDEDYNFMQFGKGGCNE